MVDGKKSNGKLSSYSFESKTSENGYRKGKTRVFENENESKQIETKTRSNCFVYCTSSIYRSLAMNKNHEIGTTNTEEEKKEKKRNQHSRTAVNEIHNLFRIICVQADV